MNWQVAKSTLISIFGNDLFIREGNEIIFILLFCKSVTLAHNANSMSGVLNTSEEPPAAVRKSLPSTDFLLIRSLNDSCLNCAGLIAAMLFCLQ